MNTMHEHYDTTRLNAIPIMGVARRLGYHLQRAGSVYKTLCPWHDDSHPSLTFYERTNENRCHCFSCGKGGSVIDFVMQAAGFTFMEACEWLSREYGISTTQSWPANKPLPKPQPRPATAAQPFTYIPEEIVGEMLSADNSLCRCLFQMYDANAVENVVAEYRIGCYAMNGIDDYTVFPNIDVYGRVCNLKAQHYATDPSSPRFAHSDKGSCYWLGAILAKEGRLPKDARFCSTCLFGEHLLPLDPDAIVVLVESPKNALFGALEHPELLWVATGNKGMLKREALQPLRGRHIIVIPDADAVDEWTDTIASMTDLANFAVSDFCRCVAPQDQPKFDIADYIANRRQPMPF